MSQSEFSETYGRHALGTNGEDYIGVLDGADSFGLREACNKIIHAIEVRPIYDRVDPPAESGDDALENPTWHLTGEIELGGKIGKKRWAATLHTQQLIEIILDRISFGSHGAKKDLAKSVTK